MASKRGKAETAGVLFVRDADLVRAVDVWVTKTNETNPDGPQWTRAMFARNAIRKALRESTT